MNPSAANPSSETTRRLGTILATVCGAGHIPGAPGTVGSAISVTAFIFLRPYVREPFLLYHLAAVVLLSLVAVWACSQSEKHFGRRDPREAILDEVAGQQIALLGLPLMGETPLALLVSGWKYIGAAFILFRIFDVAKPFPIRRVERLSGGWGMVADDLLAGGLSFLVLWIGRKLGL